ncbi:hypothetical protein PS928_06632 [Pseudomonas fluorescens]|uniref:Uncharacterized protein n=1 Tax=Pseudomonas fluorescens TaxID=294 RepID=A0A5E7VV63_PSEFL|nr:hypothetical protein PS928_06632 [Pseudomonas fluorescens]
MHTTGQVVLASRSANCFRSNGVRSFRIPVTTLWYTTKSHSQCLKFDVMSQPISQLMSQSWGHSLYFCVCRLILIPRYFIARFKRTKFFNFIDSRSLNGDFLHEYLYFNESTSIIFVVQAPTQAHQLNRLKRSILCIADNSLAPTLLGVLSRIDRKSHSYTEIFYNCTQDSGDFIRLEYGVYFLQHRTFESADAIAVSTGILCTVNLDQLDPSGG